jgi:TRAP-type C4-dicarboxylate transport system permease small subunit
MNIDIRQLFRDLERNLEGYLSTAIMGIYTVIILYTILARYLGGQFSAAWVQEVVIGGFIWLGWLSTAYVVRQDEHLRFSFFREDFSPRREYVLYWLEWIGWFIFAGVIFRFSLDTLQFRMSSGATITGTSVPKFLIFLAVPVGFGMILLRVAQQAVIITRKFRAGEELTIENIGDISQEV